MKLRRSLVLPAVLVACAFHAGAALASGSFVAPAGGATVSQNFVASVDTTGDVGASSVHFFQELSGGGTMYLGVDGVDNGSGVFSAPIAIAYDVPDGPLTIDAQIWDAGSHLIDTVTTTVNLVADTTGPSITSTSPAADASVSGTVDLSFAANDTYGIAVAEYQVEGDASWTPLTAGGGSFTASLDTVASAIPNGDLYLSLHFEDANGNSTYDEVHYVLENPQAPVIQSGTLVADKALFRADETQLESGDIVEAYGLQADGFPVPAYSYVWHLCPAGGGACTDVAANADGEYTVQQADVGSHLTLIATATNTEGSASADPVDFGVIAQGYVAPTVTPGSFVAVDSSGHTPLQIGDALTVTHAPTVTGAYPAATTSYTWYVCHDGVGCTTADGATYVVQAADARADITVFASVVNDKGADGAYVDFGAVASPPAAPSAPAPAAILAAPVVTPPAVVPLPVQQAVVVATQLVTAKTEVLVSAKQEKTAADAVVKTAEKKVAAGVAAIAAPTATAAEKQHVVATVKTLVAVKADAAEKVAAAKAAAAKAAAAKKVAASAVAAAQSTVAVAQKAVDTGAATATEKKTLAASKKRLTAAKTVEAVKADAAVARSATAVVVKKDADSSVKAAATKVDAAVTIVSAGTATPTATRQIVASVAKLVTAQAVASDKGKAVAKASTQLTAAQKALAQAQAPTKTP